MAGKSRDWGRQKMILWDGLEVFIISASHFFIFLFVFLCSNLKMAARAVLHFKITRQMTTTALGTETVLHSFMRKSTVRKKILFLERFSFCRKKILFPERFSSCRIFPGIVSPAGQYLIFELVIAGDS